MSDTRWLFEAASTQFQCVVASLEPEHWALPTNCEVSVRELVQHVVAGNEFAVLLLAGREDARSAIDDLRLGPDPLAQVESSCRAQTEAFVRADRAGTLRHPSGDITIDAFARMRLGDLALHAWDIAVAAGLDQTLDRELVDGLWTLVEPHIATMRATGVYGSGTTCTPAPGADAQDRLLAAFGRA
jgi:uncharacterized protein (TIGR03086 family)